MARVFYGTFQRFQSLHPRKTSQYADDDEHFYSLRTRFCKFIYIYNRLFTPLKDFKKYINILKADTSDGKINCYVH